MGGARRRALRHDHDDPQLDDRQHRHPHALQHDLHAGSYTDIAWVVTGYLLAQGAVIPLTGWATDRWGTKRLYLITIVMFTVASMLCGVSQNLGELIFFRVIQGIGGGMLMPIGMTIILQAVGPQNMGKVMGIFGVPMLIAPAVGPVLGGYFVQDFSWRLIFYVNVPIGIVGFIAATRFLRETHRTAKLRLDVVGLLTGVPAVIALMYAVDRSTQLGWSSALVVTLLAASVLLMGVFIVRQLRFSAPLLQLSLFRDRTFSWAMVLSFVVVTAMFGTMLLLPLYLQEVHGYDAIETGLLLLPQAAVAAISMPLGGYLTDRIGPKWVVATGMILLTIGSVVLAQIHYNSSNWLVISALMLRGFAMGFAMMPTMSAAMARVPRRYTSRASSITNTLQRVSSSVGIAVLVTVLAGQFAGAAARPRARRRQRWWPQPRSLHQPQLTASQYCGHLRQAIAASSAQESPGSTQPSTGNAVLDAFNHQYAGNVFSDAFDRTFVLVAILSALGIIPAFFLKRPDRKPQAACVDMPPKRRSHPSPARR